MVSLALRDFRCYEDALACFGEGLTVITGSNGAGKTNLLEGLYFGCTGRSCRTSNERELVRFGCDDPRRWCECPARTDPRARGWVDARRSQADARGRRKCRAVDGCADASVAQCVSARSPRPGEGATEPAAGPSGSALGSVVAGPPRRPAGLRPGACPAQCADRADPRGAGVARFAGELGRAACAQRDRADPPADRCDRSSRNRHAATRGDARPRGKIVRALPPALTRDGSPAARVGAERPHKPGPRARVYGTRPASRRGSRCFSRSGMCGPTVPRGSSACRCSHCCWRSVKRLRAP